ncbi:hypothetical protein COW36_11610 [bacterium (Candidatus Blackallbacteria) CG17_big_fil_post_rev_8_21_14_2_50_48_46]|uniref:Uncharacterized protein n=1 Tax=bacterium (Candidatus Blackallbacteria) CG17_big_fil_post_rev_8_21_14_2_50_48_46 TaxID=2014261 RepID=A0A2M7G4F3_9BACT|nr:MAG: hypothetical protein COW64_21830 [bacterium (Candidatus Blackallbacteria) CG18_big_fil_WC_8_21_14_2_50_49_26]PIW16784.1 MAG: hypothetical protein COW36_11610 [bacterium (Candidatus Blackallbacteria) CG17_big_fil_post_rev_8_21_14_2_50_48_46]PIW47072.1 MAG: hypothetical protein COW20_13810 [bacterium (Candidatus Blackallbacteria) CG13_big_fil_rev_8_21_14_2_50_49_14]
MKNARIKKSLLFTCLFLGIQFVPFSVNNDSLESVLAASQSILPQPLFDVRKNYQDPAKGLMYPRGLPFYIESYLGQSSTDIKPDLSYKQSKEKIKSYSAILHWDLDEIRPLSYHLLSGNRVIAYLLLEAVGASEKELSRNLLETAFSQNPSYLQGRFQLLPQMELTVYEKRHEGYIERYIFGKNNFLEIPAQENLAEMFYPENLEGSFDSAIVKAIQEWINTQATYRK